jgi:hypothetical protein
VNEGNEMVFHAAGGVNGANDSTGKVARTGGIYEDELVMITPIQGVLDSDVSHTTLYYSLVSPPMEKLGDTRGNVLPKEGSHRP